MPPPSNQKGNIEFEGANEVPKVSMQGFFTGALRFGSFSILAHMILMLPHPLTFGKEPPSSSSSSSSSNSHTNQKQSTQIQPVSDSNNKRPSSFFSRKSLQSRFLYRPLEGFSEWISPTSRVYRGLTPQFKVFIQIAIMTLGGCIWAEKRVAEYTELVRRIKRAERARVVVD